MHSTKFLILNKPKKVIVTRSDERGRKTVYDLLPSFALQERWMPIGRLDMDSRGLLLFTQHGHLSDLLTTPGICLKIYGVQVRGHVTEEHLRQAVKGVTTSLGILRVNHIEISGVSGPKTRLQVELKEGKNRHLRRLFGALKDPKFQTPLKVMDLKRTQIGPVKLDIQSSRWRFLTIKEEQDLIRHAESGKQQEKRDRN